MNPIQGKVAVITGAGSGIGRALALQMAKEGCPLAISDINEEGLTETASLLASTGVKVTTHVLDVADREAVYAFADAVKKAHGKVDIVVNNAGVSLTARVEDTDYDDFEWLMNINFWGVVYGTKAFLPMLRESASGHIVNISSLFGLLSMPTQSAYNAAKFAVRGFTESLRMECDLYGGNVSVTSVHPGGIKTNIVAGSRIKTMGGMYKSREKAARTFEKTSKTTPDMAAAKIIDGIKRNKRRVLIGNDAIALDILQRLLPERYQAIILKHARKAFTG